MSDSDPLGAGLENLAYAVITRAVKDAKCSVPSLRVAAVAWLRGDMCKTWCDLLDINHDRVLAWLRQLNKRQRRKRKGGSNGP